jgi:hypothetical protein
MYTTDGGKFPIMTYVKKETFEQIERERKNFSRSSYVACVLEEIFTPEEKDVLKSNISDSNIEKLLEQEGKMSKKSNDVNSEFDEIFNKMFKP